MADLKRMESISDIDAALDASRRAPVFIFKHSLTCPISATAFREFERFVDERESGETSFRLVEVQRAREVSNEIAARSGVRHESPQALLLRDGEVVWHASHGSIRASTLAAALAG